MPGLELPKLLTPTETAAQLRVSVGTLAQWRHHKRYSLRHLKIGRCVRYLESEVKAFIANGVSR
jgi:excisionase family DNA binding protein